MQRRYALILILSFLYAPPSHPQKGTAPSGYYPFGFYGSTFTGAVESTGAGELALLYTNGQKHQRFVGRLEAPCIWTDKAGATHAVDVAVIPTGTVLTAFYNSVTTKSGGQKNRENLILAISYAEQNGKKFPDDKRVIIACSHQRNLQFKAF